MNKCKILVVWALALTLALTLQLTSVAGKSYIVGGSIYSWDTSFNATEWVSSITFYTGDYLVFWYSSLEHDVWEVTESDYEACNKGSPLNKYSSGMDYIELTEAGSKSFYCSISNHCTVGMKLAVSVITNPNPSPPPPPPAITFDGANDVVINPAAVVFPILVIAVVIISVLLFIRRRCIELNASNENEILESEGRDLEQVHPTFENHKFSYNDLKKITNDFTNIIGTGGYGSVYLGILQNGTQVAVKKRSQTSSQGVEEFLAEAENLARVHHKNLVSLMGYCVDKNCMALVYEYMQEGNLHDKLRDASSPLNWKQRLQIAYESALGLEYLHTACNPPLIHRDVKTSNILLSANMEAKIADFGLSRAVSNDGKSHVTTKIVGTPGYIDPEYYLSYGQLKEKSDVYSFGVVLLEIITGRPPISAELQEEGNLVLWAHRHLSGGNIESIVDPKIQINPYDINSVWKVADLACKCSEDTSSNRPTMSAVVIELHDSLKLEISMEETRNKNIYSAPEIKHDSVSDMSVQ